MSPEQTGRMNRRIDSRIGSLLARRHASTSCSPGACRSRPATPSGGCTATWRASRRRPTRSVPSCPRCSPTSSSSCSPRCPTIATRARAGLAPRSRALPARVARARAARALPARASATSPIGSASRRGCTGATPSAPRCEAAFERVVATGSAGAGAGLGLLRASASHRWCTSCTGRSCASAGVFVAGKFEQYKRDIPYSTIVQAFRELVLDILAESEREHRGLAAAARRRRSGRTGS